MIEPFYEKDDLVLKVTVTFPAGSAITSLVGGAVEAVAQKRPDAPIAPSSISIVDANTINIAFAENTFSRGGYRLQVRATVSGITQTVVDETFTVKQSL